MVEICVKNHFGTYICCHIQFKLVKQDNNGAGIEFHIPAETTG